MSTPPPRRFISLDADPPPGFEHVAAPGRRELRGGLVALWSREQSAALACIRPQREKLRGVLLHAGQGQERERLGPNFWSFAVGELPATSLLGLAQAWLDLCSASAEHESQLQRASLVLEREQADRQRLAEKVNRETESLREALLARTKWTARATAALVHFIAEQITGLDTEALPEVIVDFLTREPLALHHARVLFEGPTSWELRAEQWTSGPDAAAPRQDRPSAPELPAPGSVAGVVHLDRQTLIMPLDTGARAALVTISRPRGFDEAESSLLGLVLLELSAVYRRRQLTAALSTAIADKDALIAELSTPLIRVWRDTVCLPIIGSVDEQRAAQMTSSLLDAVASDQLRYVILDFTGLASVDTETVAHFTSLAQAIGLLGARCALSGISPSVAQTMVDLGVDLGELPSVPSVAAALALRFREPGQC